MICRARARKPPSSANSLRNSDVTCQAHFLNIPIFVLIVAMPKFTNAVNVCLKKTMLARVPDCHFTSEDIALITKETGLEPTAIQKWASNLRWKCANNGLGHDMGSVQEYLEASQESLDEKVSLINRTACVIDTLAAPNHCPGFRKFLSCSSAAM